jgi:hypothetical protein
LIAHLAGEIAFIGDAIALITFAVSLRGCRVALPNNRRIRLGMFVENSHPLSDRREPPHI